jgi:hypothetical protein
MIHDEVHYYSAIICQSVVIVNYFSNVCSPVQLPCHSRLKASTPRARHHACIYVTTKGAQVNSIAREQTRSPNDLSYRGTPCSVGNRPGAFGGNTCDEKIHVQIDFVRLLRTSLWPTRSDRYSLQLPEREMSVSVHAISPCCSILCNDHL